MPYSVGNHVSRSAIKVLGKKASKAKVWKAVFNKGTGWGDQKRPRNREKREILHYSEVGVSMALAVRSLKCQVIDSSSSDSTNVHPPPSISGEAAVALTEQHDQEVDDSDILLCHGVQWKVVDGLSS